MWPKSCRIKLVAPPNLLKQEIVCLIPREAEHPSKKPHTDLQPSRWFEKYRVFHPFKWGFLTYLVSVFMVTFNNKICIFRQNNASTGALSTYPMVRCKTRRSVDRHPIPTHQKLPFLKVFTHLIGRFLTYLVSVFIVIFNNKICIFRQNNGPTGCDE